MPTTHAVQSLAPRLRAVSPTAWGAALLAAATVLGSGTLYAQDDLRAEFETLRHQVNEQQRLNENQSKLIEQQQKLIEQQQRQLQELQQAFDLETDRPLAKQSGGGAFSPEQQGELDRRIGDYLAREHGPTQGLQYGYANGFFLASPEGVKVGSNEIPFLLRVNSRLQLRHTLFDSHGPTNDENNFELERARLLFSGYAYTPDLAYSIQLDGDSDGNDLVDLLDYHLTYDLGHAVLDYDTGRLGLKLGKFRLPYNRARQDSGWLLQFADRTATSQFFDINRSIGIGLFGRCELFGRTINWETSVSDGFRNEQSQPNRLDRNFGYAARVTSELIGEWGTDGEPDLSYHDCPAVKVGAGFAFTRLDRNDGGREFNVLPAFADDGVNPFVADVLPAAVDEFAVLFYSVDANFKYRGFTLLSEYYFRQLTDFTGAAVDDRFDHGFLVQTGYFVWPQKLELLARWARMVGNSGTLDDDQHSYDEVAAGIAWYIRGHNLKLVFDVTHLNGAPLNATAPNIRAGDDGWLFRTQFQILF